MREFINAATNASGGGAAISAATGQLYIAGVTLIFFIGFGVWSSWLKWRDSKAIREALEAGDIKTALKRHAK